MIESGYISVSENSIESKSNRVELDNFKVSIYEIDSVIVNELPLKGKELIRYCCQLNSGYKKKRTLFFDKHNLGYTWSNCTLNQRFIENDSVRNLSIDEKMRLIDTGEYEKYQNAPFTFDFDHVYIFHGFHGVEGVYYVFFDRNGELKCTYNEGSP